MPKPNPSPPLSRRARRKRQTRASLLRAAARLFAERSVDAVPIKEITDAADVGFGSFYNHFDSKEALYDALLDNLFEEFGDALERATEHTDDCAEVIAACVRHTLMRAQRDTTWARLLLREGQQAFATSRGLGPRLLRDIQRGIAAGRFSTPDPTMSFVVVGFGVLGAVATLVEMPALIGAEAGDLPERTATVLLHTLGLSFPEAAAVARRPLPHVTDGDDDGEDEPGA